ncbi:SgcJ/EcaC family oxidoreductase [Streptomyces sp. NPDC048636]|uniref:SgcJ/EcaC family oxidoreductase n=1 Tax=Streptomyces sp. NPDC048636 TaxID=3155762 RepID=UPI0034410CC3
MAFPDERITALWQAMAECWARGDAPGFAANFSEDCDFTTVRGDKPPGRAGIADGHAALFRGAYRGSTLTAHVRQIRYPHPDIATVNAESTVTGPDGVPLADTHALAVVQRDATTGRWAITAFHNMVPLRGNRTS